MRKILFILFVILLIGCKKEIAPKATPIDDSDKIIVNVPSADLIAFNDDIYEIEAELEELNTTNLKMISDELEIFEAIE